MVIYSIFRLKWDILYTKAATELLLLVVLVVLLSWYTTEIMFENISFILHHMIKKVLKIYLCYS